MVFKVWLPPRVGLDTALSRVRRIRTDFKVMNCGICVVLTHALACRKYGNRGGYGYYRKDCGSPPNGTHFLLPLCDSFSAGARRLGQKRLRRLSRELRELLRRDGPHGRGTRVACRR